VSIDDNLTIEDEGSAVSWTWRGGEDSRPDADDVVAFALTHLHNLEQRAYGAARQLKNEDGDEEYPAEQRREIETYHRNARCDADRLRRFVKIMERRP
jgi:hypothetical protein